MKKIFVLPLAAMMLVGCGTKQEEMQTTAQEEERVEQVRTTVLQPREIERVISVSTNLQGYLTQNVAPSLTGKIEHIYCEVGDHVKKGDDLVRMDQTQYKTTKISMANLESNYSRPVRLPSSSTTRFLRNTTRQKSSWIFCRRTRMSRLRSTALYPPRHTRTVSSTEVSRYSCSRRSTS